MARSSSAGAGRQRILQGSADGTGSFETLVEPSTLEREPAGWDPATRALVWLDPEIGGGTRFMRQEPGAPPKVVFVAAGDFVSGASVSSDGRFKSINKWVGSTLVTNSIMTTGGGTTESTYVRSLSADGKVMTIDTTMKTPNGNVKKMKLIYNKQ